MKIRALAVAVLMLVTAAYLGTAARAEPTPIRRPLSELPFSIETWRGAAAPPLSSEVLEQLRVDDYTMRTLFPSGPWRGRTIRWLLRDTTAGGQHPFSPQLPAWGRLGPHAEVCTCP